MQNLVYFHKKVSHCVKTEKCVLTDMRDYYQIKSCVQIILSWDHLQVSSGQGSVGSANDKVEKSDTHGTHVVKDVQVCLGGFT